MHEVKHAYAAVHANISLLRAFVIYTSAAAKTAEKITIMPNFKSSDLTTARTIIDTRGMIDAMTVTRSPMAEARADSSYVYIPSPTWPELGSLSSLASLTPNTPCGSTLP